MKITLRKWFLFFAILSMFLGSWVVNHASAVTYTEFKLTASEPKPNGHFGNSVSISGDYAIVGIDDNPDSSA